MKIKEQTQTFLKWWRNTLVSIFPPFLNLIVFGYPHAKRVLSQSDIERSGIGSGATRKGVFDVVLAKEDFLVRTFDLPAKVGRNAASAIDLNLANNVPFALSEVYWATNAQKVADRLECTQYVIKKSKIEALRSKLKGEGVKLRKTYVSAKQPILMEDFGWELAAPNAIFRISNVALIVFFLLLVTAVRLHENRSAQSLNDQYSTIVAEQRMLAKEKRKTLSELEAQDKLKQSVFAKVEQSSELLRVLGSTTQGLPDDAWMTQITYHNSGVSMSANAKGSVADIVLELSNDPMIRDAKINGAVSKDRSTDSEKFKLQFALGEQD